VIGIAHAFQGTLNDLLAWLDIGCYISIGAESLGIWRTIKKAPPVSAEVIRAIPDDRLLIETDSMFHGEMLPASPPEESPKISQLPAGQIEYRQPADVLMVAEKIAVMRSVSPDDIGNLTTQNLKRLLKAP
jgi:Tat protein secretion system quality control protein TatD with DNase activity